jgi:hypothetical protein
MTNPTSDLMYEQPQLADRVAPIAAGNELFPRLTHRLVQVYENRLAPRSRAAANGLVPTVLFGFLDGIISGRRFEWESHPYHLGWVLQTWLWK